MACPVCSTRIAPEASICPQCNSDLAVHKRIHTIKENLMNSGEKSAIPKAFLWGFQTTLLALLAALAFLLFSNHERIVIIEKQQLQISSILAKQSSETSEVSQLLNSLSSMSRSLEKTLTLYEAQNSHLRELTEKPGPESARLTKPAAGFQAGK